MEECKNDPTTIKALKLCATLAPTYVPSRGKKDKEKLISMAGNNISILLYNFIYFTKGS